MLEDNSHDGIFCTKTDARHIPILCEFLSECLEDKA